MEAQRQAVLVAEDHASLARSIANGLREEGYAVDLTFDGEEALVDGLITPIVAAIFGEPDFSSLSFTINHSQFRYGLVIDAVLTFLATAAAVYFLVIVPYKAYQEAKGVSAKTRPCPECTTSISVAAKRCPHCTATVLPDPVG